MLEYILCWITIIICINFLYWVNFILRIHYFNLWWYMRKGYIEYTVCTNFVKELVILFHQTSADPWGSCGVHYKKELHWRFFLFLPLPLLLATGPFFSSPWQQTYLVPSTIQDPRAMNTCAELKGTGHTAKFQQAFYLQALPNLTKPYLTLPYLIPLPYNFTL